VQGVVFFGEAKADHLLVKTVAVKGRQRDGGDADVAREPLAEVGFGQRALGHGELVDAGALEVRAFARQQAKARAREARTKQLALGGVKGGQVQGWRGVGHVRGQAVLHGRVDGEHVELVNFAQLRRQRGGRGDVAHLPAGHVEGFAKASDDEAARRQAGVARHAFVPQRGIDHVLVHLVADQQHVGGGQQFVQPAHVVSRPNRAAGVVRRVDDDRAGARAKGGGNAAEVGPERARRERHAHHGGAAEFNAGHVAVVAGLQHHHLVARPGAAQHGGEDGLRAACGDGDFRRRVVNAAIQRRHLARDGFAQRRGAGHGRVLVVALAHGGVNGVHQLRVAVKVRKALPQIDRLMLGGQRRHHAENGGAHMRQAGGEGGGKAHVCSDR
jgi:hypothetical protein